VLRYGSGDDDPNLAGALLNWEQQGTGSVATVQLAGESHPRGMRLAVPGRHMALNALGALLAAREVGGSVDSVLDGLAGFEGVRRRFESVGTSAGIRVFDDYAHHPTEVRATLEALRAVAGEARSIVVFQPHLYSRTKTFAREFGEALSGADEVFVLDVYAAREQPLAGVSGASVAEHVTTRVRYVPDFSAVASAVAAVARPRDVVVTMGAGDVTLLGREILTALQVEAERRAPGGGQR
jgi:UDP-N-acetylmuramate--alanine ligase